MTDTCPRCGSKQVILVETAGGYPVLRNLGGPHYYSCKKGPGRPKADELVQALTVQFGPEAKRLAAAARKRKPKGGLEELVLEAIAIRGSEG
ncbi:MAG TPA: hypothetical protein VJB57_19275 [Dehalococcoidia bacterium]|nr:hypothetical protein [Dehalococcoidia bacterium]